MNPRKINKIKYSVLSITFLLLVGGKSALNGPFPIVKTNINQLKFDHVKKDEKTNTESTEADIQNGPSTIGRFLYLGPIPKFNPKDLDLTASKLGLTLRVQAWFDSDLLEKFEKTLITRWFRAYSAFSTHTNLKFETLKNPEMLSQQATDPNEKKWYKTAEAYSHHYLENTGVDIYSGNGDSLEYKKKIFTAALRKLLNDNKLEIEDGLNLYKKYSEDSNFSKQRTKESSELFAAHFGTRWTSSDERPGKMGYITFVYPIASHSEGPFSEPKEGISQFPLNSSYDARWWSNKWKDEFGGFPFMLVTPGGVAFHGPITMNYKDTWFLRRDYVSHSCFRMDGSDVMELRMMYPENIKTLERKKNQSNIRVLNWFDTSDYNNDGQLELVDSAYYRLPVSGRKVKDFKPYLPLYAKKNFWTTQTSVISPIEAPAPIDLNKKLKSVLEGLNLPFSPLKVEFKESISGIMESDPYAPAQVLETFVTGIPRYEISNGSLKMIGQYGKLPVHSYEMRETSIIQYRDTNVIYDNKLMDQYGHDDYAGEFPQTYFYKE